MRCDAHAHAHIFVPFITAVKTLAVARGHASQPVPETPTEPHALTDPLPLAGALPSLSPVFRSHDAYALALSAYG